MKAYILLFIFSKRQSCFSPVILTVTYIQHSFQTIMFPSSDTLRKKYFLLTKYKKLSHIWWQCDLNESFYKARDRHDFILKTHI